MLSWDMAMPWIRCQQKAKCLGDLLARHFLAVVFELKPILFFSVQLFYVFDWEGEIST